MRKKAVKSAHYRLPFFLFSAFPPCTFLPLLHTKLILIIYNVLSPRSSAICVSIFGFPLYHHGATLQLPNVQKQEAASLFSAQLKHLMKSDLTEEKIFLISDKNFSGEADCVKP